MSCIAKKLGEFSWTCLYASTFFPYHLNNERTQDKFYLPTTRLARKIFCENVGIDSFNLLSKPAALKRFLLFDNQELIAKKSEIQCVTVYMVLSRKVIIREKK